MMRLLVSITFLLSLFLSCTSSESETEVTTPNILFLIADDWSFPHAGVYGDPVLRTPTFDQLASEGALFFNAYCAAPSCSPSRAAILTGRYPHQLESAGNLWSVIPDKFPNWVSLLSEAGYHTGSWRKGWGPGDYEMGGYTHNPAGKHYDSFDEFLEAKQEKDQAFCFWFGSSDPHRVYETNAGVRSGMKTDLVRVPGFLPDTDCVRNDILDYYFEVERFDRECGQILDKLRATGELDNTIVIMTSDNGMPFPRAKANLYDYGTRMPLVIYWKDHIKPGIKVDQFVNFIDFAPTLTRIAGLETPTSFSGMDLAPVFNEQEQEGRDRVFLERERHANVRKGDLSYPCRAVRTNEFLYIRNFESDRWPAGDSTVHQSVGQFGDIDNSISKFQIMQLKGQGGNPDYYNLSFGKRPAEELYQVREDPFNLNNLATNPAYAQVLTELSTSLNNWMSNTDDLRAIEPHTNYWDTVRYTPNYQHQNYNLQEEIQAYKRLQPKPWGNFIEVPCN
jgi:arylsulfatase A-like enzyme